MIDKEQVRSVVKEALKFQMSDGCEYYTLPKIDEQYLFTDEQINESLLALGAAIGGVVAATIATKLAGLAFLGWIIGKSAAPATPVAATTGVAANASAAAFTSIKAAFASIGIVNPAIMIGVGAVGAALLLYGGYRFLTRQKPRKGVASDPIAAHLVKAVNDRDNLLKKKIGSGDEGLAKKLEKPTNDQMKLGFSLEKAAKDDYLARRIDSNERDQLDAIAKLAKQGKLSYL